MICLTNAFSINMLAHGGQTIDFVPVTLQGVKNLLKNEQWESAIGHSDMAIVLSEMLGVKVEVNRATITLDNNSLIVAQYTGPRLEEGATTLPEGAKIEFWQVYHRGI